MGRSVQFDEAVSILSQLAPAEDDEATFQTREEMEAIVLDHAPASPAEAAAILDVLLTNLAPGVRSDGRDLRALHGLKAWCLALHSRIVLSPSARSGPLLSRG